MTDIDDTADALSSVRSGEGFGSLPIVAVEDGSPAVEVTVELPSGDRFTEALDRPPVWGANCRLKTLLDAFDLGPDEIDRLEGETVPCERGVADGSMEFAIDLEELQRQRSGE